MWHTKYVQYIVIKRHTPPQCRVRARSFPVPIGNIAIGGVLIFKVSIVDKIQPTVPSPPQTKTIKLGTFLKSFNLKSNKQK